ncbi:unnamed protein product [Caenorhabditis nigoni]
MRLLLVILLILYNLPLKNAASIYEFSLPELQIGKNHTMNRYFQNKYIDALHEMCQKWSTVTFSFLMSSLPIRWISRNMEGGRFNVDRWLESDRFNVVYPLRKLFYFVIFMKKISEYSQRDLHYSFYVFPIVHYCIPDRNRIQFFRQLMVLEFIYIVAKYTVDDIRSVIWPFILVNEIWDLFTIFKYRTTEFLPFEIQLVKIWETFQYFILLNQYPDFSVLIWLTVIATLQLLPFFLYFFFPPLTWTVPILDIAPSESPKNRYMIYTRYVAIAFVLLVFWALSGGIPHFAVVLSFFATGLVYYISYLIYLKYYR